MGDVIQMDRPKFTPTPEQRVQVKSLAAFGISHERISKYLTIAPKTLRKHFRRELDCGATEADVKVAQALFKLAIEGNVLACIFWTKHRTWREQLLPSDFRTAAPPALVIQGPTELDKAA
jgi:hypothetical protein